MDELAQAQARIKELEESIRVLEANQASGSRTVTISASDPDSDATDHEFKQRLSQNKKKTKKPTIKRVLKDHQKIIKDVSEKILDNDEADDSLRQLVNSLSKTTIDQAVKAHKQVVVTGPHQELSPPDLPKEKASPTSLKESISALKDLYRSQVLGRDGEDITPYLQAAGQIAIDNELNEKQFYLLIKSRVLIGSNLYVELCTHEELESPIKVLYRELLPLYGNSGSYLTYLDRLNNFKPAGNMAPNVVLARVKTMATDLAKASTKDPLERKNAIYSYTRDKILISYPLIAPQIIEREAQIGSKSVSNLAHIFLNLVSVSSEYKKNNKRVNEFDEDDAEPNYR